MAISRRLLANAIAARLAGVTNAVGYYGQVGRTLAGTLGVDPQPKSATDQRVKPYFILFPSAGQPGPDPDLGDCNVDLTQPFQITVAGGDMEDVLALADRVDGRIFRWIPTLSGAVCGPVKPPEGFTAPPVLTDKNFTPNRLYVPLLYQLTATT